MVNIKFIIVPTLLYTVVAQILPEENKILLQYHHECKSETNISDALMFGTAIGRFPDDPVLNKQIFCISKKIGYQNEAGDIQRDVMKAVLHRLLKDPEEVNGLMERCIIHEDTPERTAATMAKCYYDYVHNT